MRRVVGLFTFIFIPVAVVITAFKYALEFVDDKVHGR